jgi:ACT domain-containing protein
MLSTKRVKISVILIGDIVKNNVRLVINKGEAKAEIYKKIETTKIQNLF